MIARDYAYNKHSDQMYGNVPYVFHLDDVHNVLIRFNFTDKDLRICAYLHDILEDTDTSYDELMTEFNEQIANVVFAVTDEDGKNRKEKKAKTYPKTRKNPDAIIIKLADRIANVENAIKNNNSIIQMYKKEHVEFKQALYIPNTNAEVLWEHLDQLMKDVKNNKG